MILSYMIHIKPLDNKEREIYIHIQENTKYNILYMNMHKQDLPPILPYITWGFIQDPQNKKRNPREEY